MRLIANKNYILQRLARYLHSNMFKMVLGSIMGYMFIQGRESDIVDEVNNSIQNC